MSKHYTKEELFEMDAVEVYKLVLRREINRFPAGFWTQSEALNNTKSCIKFMIEEILKWNDEDIKEKLSYNIFKENKLSGMVQHAFNGSPYDAINSAYPNRFKEWEFKNVPLNFWTLETGTKAAKWLIEEKLKWTDEDIKEKISTKIFKDNKLSGMLQYVFNASPYDTVNSVYPNRFKQWEFKQGSKDYWTLETGIKATKWLIEEKLKWTDEDIKEKLSQNSFTDNSLNGMLQYVFKNSPYDAINAVWPNRFKRWELKSSVPKNYWTLGNGIKATKWLIEEKLKWTDEDIKDKLSSKMFKDNNLGSMLKKVFNGSPYDAINAVWPNRFNIWELNSNVPKNYWTLENGIKTTKWLIEEKLKWTDEDIKDKISSKIFKDNKLYGMLSTLFKGSAYGAIDAAYPNRFKKEDLKSYQDKVAKNK